MKSIGFVFAFIASLVVAAGPQTGGFGFGGNPRPEQYQYAFFEAFPSTGLGTFGSCPLPNWCLQSETLENVSWTDSSTPVALTRTANFALSPIGDLTA